MSTNRLISNASEPPMAQFRSEFFKKTTKFFTRSNSTTRKSALDLITVLGKNLSNNGDKEIYRKEVDEILLNILLCFADRDDEVKFAAQKALGSFSKCLPDNCLDLIKKQVDNRRLHTGEFTAEFCSRISTSYPPETTLKILTDCEIQLGNTNGAVRAQTATIIAAVVKSFPHRERLKEIAERLIPIFFKLLNDESSDCRARAGEALSYLHNF